MTVTRARRAWIWVCFFCANAAGAVEWTPTFSGNLSGGQYFFQKQRASFAGNAGITAAGLAKLSDRWSVLPMYAGHYQGTKGIDDGVGAGTLFQQQMDHALSVTGIRRIESSGWRLKPSAGYKREFLKQTRDETWGKGLFDYENISLGFEIENIYKDPFAWRVGLDVFQLRFPHYDSLESQSGVDPLGNPLGRELAPRRVLDTMNWQLSASGSRPWPFEDPKIVLQGSYALLYKGFSDQRIVNEAGQFNNSKRRDYVQSASFSAGRPMQLDLFNTATRLDLSLGLNLVYDHSNQNTYDATFAKFIENSYSYLTMGAGPAATLSWGESKAPTWVSAAFRVSRQSYFGRRVQDAGGAYTSAKQRHDRYAVSLAYGYPIAPQFTMTFKTNILWATSNHRYSQNYAYDYRTANYLIGVSYEY